MVGELIGWLIETANLADRKVPSEKEKSMKNVEQKMPWSRWTRISDMKENPAPNSKGDYQVRATTQGGAPVTINRACSDDSDDLAAIDPALRERPSRFDVVLKIGLPSLAARRAILEKNLPTGSAAGELLDMAAGATADLSGAHVREVAYLAVQRALLRDACDAEGKVRPGADDFILAIEQVGGARKTIPGFAAGRSTACPDSVTD